MTLFGPFVDTMREMYIKSSDSHHKNFVVKYRDQHVHVSFGKVSNQFILECKKLFEELALEKASVMGRFDGRMKLYFSHQIEEKDHQKFRNIWNVTP